jgi:hypothetical protein
MEIRDMLTKILLVFGLILSGIMILKSPVYCLDDSTLTPYDQIPEIYRPAIIANYDSLLAEGTVSPCKIMIDSVAIGMGTSEANLLKRLKDYPKIQDSAVYRTREEQWKYIQHLLIINCNTMYFYDIYPAYYNDQMKGWFKTFAFTIAGVGKIRAFLHCKSKNSTFSIWFLQVEMDRTARENVNMKKGKGYILERKGERVVVWNIDKDHVLIQ